MNGTVELDVEFFSLFSLSLTDHGVVNERKQAENARADSSQSDVFSLSRCAAGGRTATEPMSRHPAGSAIRTSLHDRSGRV